MDLSIWNESAVEYLENKNAQRSIELIEQIADPSARVLFNLSRSYEVVGQLHKSLQSLDRVLMKDPHCAVGFFQRGVIYFKMQKYPEALSDFENSQKWVQHGHIDYSQLGMRYKLYFCEILYNCAVTLLKLNHTSQALEFLSQAQTLKTEARHRVIGSLYEQLQNGSIPAVTEPIELPVDMIFRPPKYKPKSDKKVDYLGQAKVLSAIDVNDQITGFAGPHRPKLENPQGKSPIAGILASEGRRQSEPALKFTTRGSLDSPRQPSGTHGPPPDRPVPRLPPSVRQTPQIQEEEEASLYSRKHIRMSEEPPERPPPRKGNVNSLMTSMTMSTDENTAPPRPPKRISNPDPGAPTKVKVEFSCNEKQTVLLQKGASLRELKSTACQVFELKPADFDLWTEEPRKKLSAEADVKELWSKLQGEKLSLSCFAKK